MCRGFICLCLALFAPFAAWAGNPSGYGKVEIAPTRTSIYVGTVSMTMPTFVRDAGKYTSAYEAKVFPYFFYNEKGTLVVEVSDEQVAKLARGEPIEFTGKAVNSDNEERRVSGKATPKDAKAGAIKVRVWVSKSIELIFNTTYQFRD